MTVKTVSPDFGFLKTVQAESQQAVSSCFRCFKCTAGCPMAEEMDYQPDRLVRMVQFGLREEALRSRAIWLCTGCLACSDRCPNGIDVARVIDTLKQMSIREACPAGDPRISDFHQSFLGVVRRYGRLHEATLIALLKLKSRDLTSDLGSGLRMFLKGKIPPLPQRVRGRGEVAGLFEAASRTESSANGGGGIE